MAIDQPQDVLHSVTKKLLPELTDTFTRAHPAFDKIRSASKNEPFETNRTYFDIMTGDPATSIHIQTGGELLSATRKKISRQGYIDPARTILLYDVPNWELARCGSKADIVKVFEKYPGATVMGAHERAARQFFRGASSASSDPSGDYGFKGFCTLNADQSFVPAATSFRGVLGYTGRTAAPDSGAGQTGTVFGIPQENAATDAADGWYHQYGNIGSMSTDGRRIINTTLQRARYQGKILPADVDIMMCDEATYQNLVMDMEGLTFISSGSIESPSTGVQSRDGVMYGKIPLYHEPEISLADTTAYTTSAALTGILIGLTSATWRIGFAGGHSAQATNGNFQAMAPILLQDKDAWQYRLVVDWNAYCTDLRRQMIVTGGAQE